jgi:hypothetical protein
MADIATVACPTCGGQFCATTDSDRFACALCGNEHLVPWGAWVVATSLVAEGLDGIHRSVDRTPSELAIERLTSEILDSERKLAKETGAMARSDFNRLKRRVHRLDEVRYQECLNLTPLRRESRAWLGVIVARLAESELNRLVGSGKVLAEGRDGLIHGHAAKLR